MRRAKLLVLLQENLPKLQQYGVKSLAVFGSVARDEATPTSDVDLLVEFDQVVTFDRYMDVKFLLEDAVGRSIDLVSTKMLKPQIRETILQEAIDLS